MSHKDPPLHKIKYRHQSYLYNLAKLIQVTGHQKYEDGKDRINTSRSEPHTNRWDVGVAGGRSSVGSSWNIVGDDIYGETAGNCGTVGGVTTNI